MGFSEIKLMEKIQTFNLAEQMKVISKPFNTEGFILMVIILFVYKILNFQDILLLGKGVIASVLLKFIFKRTRPYMACDKIKNYSGKVHNTSTNQYSFPSGHTFMATFFSVLMLYKFPNEFIFNIISVLVGLSRISLGVHYPTDIIGGMLFGFIFFQILV